MNFYFCVFSTKTKTTLEFDGPAPQNSTVFYLLSACLPACPGCMAAWSHGCLTGSCCLPILFYTYTYTYTHTYTSTSTYTHTIYYKLYTIYYMLYTIYYILYNIGHPGERPQHHVGPLQLQLQGQEGSKQGWQKQGWQICAQVQIYGRLIAYLWQIYGRNRVGRNKYDTLVLANPVSSLPNQV